MKPVLKTENRFCSKKRFSNHGKDFFADLFSKLANLFKLLYDDFLKLVRFLRLTICQPSEIGITCIYHIKMLIYSYKLEMRSNFSSWLVVIYVTSIRLRLRIFLIQTVSQKVRLRNRVLIKLEQTFAGASSNVFFIII